ncbi:hypothetical protein Q0Z83_022100 [Actinoplanes sichuanensis]|uniref:DUF6924 domain-containing protein n=1 Tax=Actinoplanes sichuanensis TaxID=512349 RepID=UPI00367260DF|nr:hypothetical protein Q0Z83_022100 [Actinoplanes sichuanensis]
MLVLPQPEDLHSLVLRIDFSNDTAWAEPSAALASEGASLVSEPRFAGLTVQALVNADAEAGEDDKLTYVFLADATTMTDDEHPLLAIDLYDEPGRVSRVPPRRYADVSANLSIANMDFQEFADAADSSGVYRGFE